MKRNFATLIILLLPLLMTSCWRVGEDWSLCGVDHNLVLKFHVQSDSKAKFGDIIKNVDIFLFDAGYNFMEQRRISEAGSDGTYGTTFTVDPGTYHVVCWANAGANSRLSSMDVNSRPSAMNPNSNLENSFIEIISAETGDPIYYAPDKAPRVITRRGMDTRASEDYSYHAIKVLAGVVTTKDLIFRKAHREVEIFVSGFENVAGHGGKGPAVKKDGAGGKFDFLLRHDLTHMSLKQATVKKTVHDTEMFTADFLSMLIPVTDDMAVTLYHPATGEELASVNLKQYIAGHGIMDLSYIPIQFDFKPSGEGNVSVSVKMPSWIDNGIVPDL